MLFVYNVILKVVFEKYAFCAVCIHRNVKGSCWKELCWVLFLYIILLNVAFRENCVMCSLYTS